jgi:hypothetical protein
MNILLPFIIAAVVVSFFVIIKLRDADTTINTGLWEVKHDHCRDGRWQ